MNVLLTSAGRRNYLVRYFREAVGDLGEVLVADVDSTAPALYEGCRRVELPRAENPSFSEQLLAECLRHRVGLVIPLNDLELGPMARARSLLERHGVRVAVADEGAVRLCLDKWQTAIWLAKEGVPAPRTYLGIEEGVRALKEGRLAFPVVVKPRYGSGSIGIEIVEDVEELKAAAVLVRKKIERSAIARLAVQGEREWLLVQEFVDGTEYGLDVINDLDGNYVGTIVRMKLRMRAGETDCAEIVHFEQLEALGQRVGRVIRHRGNLDVDVIVGKDGPVVLELNPRFGGGYPFSHEAGADLPRALILWAKGFHVEKEILRPKIGWRGAKYDMIIGTGA